MQSQVVCRAKAFHESFSSPFGRRSRPNGEEKGISRGPTAPVTPLLRLCISPAQGGVWGGEASPKNLFLHTARVTPAPYGERKVLGDLQALQASRFYATA